MRRRQLLILAACLLVPAAGLTWRIAHGAAPSDRAGTAAPGAPAQAVPATVGAAERKDVPIYLNGLGTVQAFNTVTVNTRVDGELDKVEFAEGQDVKAGDILAQIDPRPFQAALDLAQATKAKDEAQLANARLDLERYRRRERSPTPSSRSTRKARWCSSSTPLFAPTRPISKPRRCSSTTRRSLADHPDAPAYAWWIRATSCTPPTPPAWS